ncbi:hypothetical protein B0T22DRAFT_161312 [Podospora appendiculata]|uniref:Uncharacterized protein n=1 Tax=Podospora appendiculata TaxID=314037 RepID=A0AAE0XA02_9PEZI|nr:hypothetical protein B0T22DRAFT_161312 [Podospora appendiculata]
MDRLDGNTAVCVWALADRHRRQHGINNSLRSRTTNHEGNKFFNFFATHMFFMCSISFLCFFCVLCLVPLFAPRRSTLCWPQLDLASPTPCGSAPGPPSQERKRREIKPSRLAGVRPSAEMQLSCEASPTIPALANALAKLPMQVSTLCLIYTTFCPMLSVLGCRVILQQPIRINWNWQTMGAARGVHSVCRDAERQPTCPFSPTYSALAPLPSTV